AGRLDEARQAANTSLTQIPPDSDAANTLRQYISVADHSGTASGTATPAGDIRLLAEALQDAFARVEDLADLPHAFGLPDVRVRLPVRQNARDTRDLATTALTMVSVAAADRWLGPLVLAARRARPENLQLWRFAQRRGLSARGYPETDDPGFAAAVEPKLRA